jgi:hypothetical protein
MTNQGAKGERREFNRKEKCSYVTFAISAVKKSLDLN